MREEYLERWNKELPNIARFAGIFPGKDKTNNVFISSVQAFCVQNDEMIRAYFMEEDTLKREELFRDHKLILLSKILNLCLLKQESIIEDSDNAWNKIEPISRAVYFLKHVEKLSFEEISRVTKLNRVKVIEKLHQARAILQKSEEAVQ